jgi:hypothetical protein
LIPEDKEAGRTRTIDRLSCRRFIRSVGIDGVRSDGVSTTRMERSRLAVGPVTMRVSFADCGFWMADPIRRTVFVRLNRPTGELLARISKGLERLRDERG